MATAPPPRATSQACWITRRGCTLAWQPNSSSPGGTGGKRRHPVASRIPASERTSRELDELLTRGVAGVDARAELLELAVRKIVEEALEAEVAGAKGRGYYENGAPPGVGYRNGYRRRRLAIAEGLIEYGVPQVTDRAEPFASRVRASLAGRTAELERLAVEMFARVEYDRRAPRGGGRHGVPPRTSRSTSSTPEWMRPLVATRAGASRSRAPPDRLVMRPPASSTMRLPAATSHGPSRSSQ